MTYTVAELGVSQPTYDEIRSLLRAAKYDHLFMASGMIDMHGIGLVLDLQAQPRAVVTVDAVIQDHTEPSELDIEQQMAGGPAATLNDGYMQNIREAVAEALGEAYDCLRVWSAWSAGTMGPDDFRLVAEDGDRVEEIVQAVLNALPADKRHKPDTRDEEIGDLRNVIQVACISGLPGLKSAWEKYFPDHPITVRTASAPTPEPLHKRALEIADEAMLVQLRSHGYIDHRKGDRYRLPKPRNALVYEAVQWLEPRGMVRLGSDMHGEFLDLVQPPEGGDHG